jgi:hypothetical protein
MAIKAVVFDADGVVINSPGYFSVQYEKKFGVPNDVLIFIMCHKKTAVGR